MSDLRKQIRDHYDAQSLPPEKVDAILAKGRALAAAEADPKITPFPQKRWSTRRWIAIAACIAILVEIGVIWLYSRGGDFEKLRPAVVAFFANKPMYPVMSPEPAKLREWAVAHGAPADFQIPAKLRNLPSKGCTILDVDGKPAYLICFMTVDADGKPDGGMVHLLIARRSDFRHAPQSATRTPSAAGEWNFVSWAEGDVVYTVAAPDTAETVRGYVLVRAVDGQTEKTPLGILAGHRSKPSDADRLIEALHERNTRLCRAFGHSSARNDLGFPMLGVAS